MQFLRLFFLAALVHWAAAISAGAAKNVLSIHNKYRAKHSAPALAWDPTLEKYAQSWANKCQFQHTRGPYGENLAWGFGNWEGAVSAWFSEGDKYNYNAPGKNPGTGHFTQIVWKSTTKLGCGIKKCPNGMNYVCSYAAPGNMVTSDGYYYKINVLQG